MAFPDCSCDPALLTNSILGNVKRYLGFDFEDESYDEECLASIGTSLFILRDRGMQVPEGFEVTSLAQTWEDLLGPNNELEGVRSYVMKRARLDIDPPSNSFTIQAIEKQIAELEFRISVKTDTPRYSILEGGATNE